MPPRYTEESQPSNSSLAAAAARKTCRVVSSASCGCKQSTHRHTPSLAKSSLFKKLGIFLELCVSSLRRGHANLLCIVPILSDDPRRESGKWCISYVHVVPAHATILHISKMTTTPFIFLATATPYRSLQDKSPNTIFIYTSHTHYSHYSTCASEKRAPSRNLSHLPRKSNGLRRRHFGRAANGLLSRWGLPAWARIPQVSIYLALKKRRTGFNGPPNLAHLGFNPPPGH